MVLKNFVLAVIFNKWMIIKKIVAEFFSLGSGRPVNIQANSQIYSQTPMDILCQRVWSGVLESMLSTMPLRSILARSASARCNQFIDGSCQQAVQQKDKNKTKGYIRVVGNLNMIGHLWFYFMAAWFCYDTGCSAYVIACCVALLYC